MRQHQTVASALEQVSSASALALVAIIPTIAEVTNKPMHRLTVTSGDRETELPSDLLDIKNIRQYAASIF
jgi:hypothetical protein